jgi:small subunit ribosomal protein S19e
MVTVYDVDPNMLIEHAAKKLKAMGIEKPAFVGMVKSGSHTERPPEQEDFWYIRCASLLRQTYVKNVIGVNRLRRHYGGRKSRGVKPAHHRDAGGAIIRKALQILEKHGFLVKTNRGRSLTPKGRSFLDNTAKEIAK